MMYFSKHKYTKTKGAQGCFHAKTSLRAIKSQSIIRILVQIRIQVNFALCNRQVLMPPHHKGLKLVVMTFQQLPPFLRIQVTVTVDIEPTPTFAAQLDNALMLYLLTHLGLSQAWLFIGEPDHHHRRTLAYLVDILVCIIRLPQFVQAFRIHQQGIGIAEKPLVDGRITIFKITVIPRGILHCPKVFPLGVRPQATAEIVTEVFPIKRLPGIPEQRLILARIHAAIRHRVGKLWENSVSGR